MISVTKQRYRLEHTVKVNVHMDVAVRKESKIFSRIHRRIHLGQIQSPFRIQAARVQKVLSSHLMASIVKMWTSVC